MMHVFSFNGETMPNFAYNLLLTFIQTVCVNEINMPLATEIYC